MSLYTLVVPPIETSASGVGRFTANLFSFLKNVTKVLGAEQLTVNHRRLDSSDNDTKLISLRTSLLGLKV